ncbi:hypothetical protein GCM10010341_24940 [Streptomyces noursei]|nr:hypothetical protein GCM10010341_24940 [Streptomyces noursei]
MPAVVGERRTGGGTDGETGGGKDKGGLFDAVHGGVFLTWWHRAGMTVTVESGPAARPGLAGPVRVTRAGRRAARRRGQVVGADAPTISC